MRFQKINGMELERYIAANLLSDSSYKGQKYYEKEDKYTQIIKACLDKAQVENISKPKEKKGRYTVIIHCWDPDMKGGFVEYDDTAKKIFKSYKKALAYVYQSATEELADLNECIYKSIEDAEEQQEKQEFRLDRDGEDICIIRKWDGDDYWPVTRYDIKEI